MSSDTGDLDEATRKELFERGNPEGLDDTIREELVETSGIRPYLSRLVETQMEVFSGQPLGQFGVFTVVIYVFVGVFAPWLAPYEPTTTQTANGEPLSFSPPSLAHPMGTTDFGYDVLSQVIISTRLSLLVGLLAAFVAVGLGTAIGIVSGYYGGWIDSLLMRITDIAYGIPFLPFMIVLVIMLSPSIWTIIFAISFLMWRSSARVIRSQVLTLRERPYIESARAAGVSDARILYRHLLPNVLPMAFLYVAFSVNIAIMAEAGLAFLGYGDPNSISWGTMMFKAYQAGALRLGWWWIVMPGVALALIIVAIFAITRAFERVTNPELEMGS